MIEIVKAMKSKKIIKPYILHMLKQMKAKRLSKWDWTKVIV